MKVFVVTNGCYSDYTIERLFSNRPAAEEYKKWHGIRNEIEEFEVYDEPFTAEDGERVILIRVQGTVYPEAVVDIKYEIRSSMIYDGTTTRGAGIMKSMKPGAFVIYNYCYIPAEKWDEEKYKTKFTKSLYDLAGIAKALLADGASMPMVDEALMNKFEED